MQRADPGAGSIGQELSTVADAKIAQVVAMVDALPARGSADALLEPLRPRIAQLRLSRPLRLGRLLFTPLDPVLMDDGEWRRSSPGVPRPALQPLVALVRAGLMDEAAAIEARLCLHDAADRSAMLEMGRLVWSRAAAILRAAQMPRGWETTGLKPADFDPIVEAVGLVLEQAVWIEEAASGIIETGIVDTAARILNEQLHGGVRAQVAVRCLMAVLLARLPGAVCRVASIEAKLNPEARPLLRRLHAPAFAFLLDRLAECGSLTRSLSKAAEMVQSDAKTLNDMVQAAISDPQAEARLESVRRLMDERCRARFDTSLSVDLAIPGSGAGAATPLGPDAVLALEETARGLYGFARAARCIGGSTHYRAALRETAERLARAQDTRLSHLDRVRLVEILLGSDDERARLT